MIVLMTGGAALALLMREERAVPTSLAPARTRQAPDHQQRGEPMSRRSPDNFPL